MYRDTTNVQHEMCDHTSSIRSHRKSNRRFKGKFEAIIIKHSTDSLQKTVILGTSHIMRKVLQCETGRLSGGDHRWFETVAYPGILLREGGKGSTNSVEDRGQRERGSGGGSPLVRGPGGSCNLVQEISFHIVKVLLL